MYSAFQLSNALCLTVCDLVYMSAGTGGRRQSSSPRLAAAVPYMSANMTCSFVPAMIGELITVQSNPALSSEFVHPLYY